MDLAALDGRLIDEGKYRIGAAMGPRLARGIRVRDRASIRVHVLELDEELTRVLEGPVPEVDHRNVVPIYDWGIVDGLGYLITPAVDGTLDDLLEEGPVTADRALGILLDLVRGVMAVHTVAPALVNLRPMMVAFSTEWNADRVRVPLGPWTLGAAAGHRLGGYCAPEADLGDVGFGVDQYSLGVIAFELLTGTTPHNPDAPPGERTALPILPHALVPSAVEGVIERLLSGVPERRYESWNALEAAVDEARRGLGVSTVGRFTPLITAPRSQTPQPVQSVDAPPPPADSILRSMLVLLVCFACAMALSGAIFMLF